MGKGKARSSYRESVGFGALSFIVMALLGFGSSIAIARAYGIDVVGESALVLAPVMALALVSSVREQSALVRKLSVLEPRDPRVTGLFYAVLTFSSAFTAVMLIPTIIITYILFDGPVNRPDLFMPALVTLIGMGLLVGNIGWNFDSVFAAFRAGRQLFWNRLIEALSFLIIAIAAGVIWGSVWGIVGATLGSQAVSLGVRIAWAPNIMRFIVPWSEIREGFRTLPELLIFGLKVAPGFVAEGIAAQSSTWILGITQPIAAVGAWGRAYQLYIRLNQGTNRITEMLLPTLVERRDKGDHAGYDRSLVDSIRYTSISLLMAGAAGGGAAVGVMNLFGPGFEQAATGLALLLLVPAVSSVGRLLNTCLLAEDMPGRTAVVSIGHASVTLILSIALSPWLGITGAAIAVLAGWSVTVVWLGCIAATKLSTPFTAYWRPREILALVGAFVSGFIVARLIDGFLPGVLGMFAALILGSAVYLAVLVGLGGINDRDRARVRDMIEKRRRRSATSPEDVEAEDEERLEYVGEGMLGTAPELAAAASFAATTATDEDIPVHHLEAEREREHAPPHEHVSADDVAAQDRIAERSGFDAGLAVAEPSTPAPEGALTRWGLALAMGGTAAILVAILAGALTADRFLLLAGICAGVALVYLAWNTDPAWALSIGIGFSVFSSHWDRLGFPLGLDRVLIGTALAAVLFRAPPVRGRRPLYFGWIEWMLAAVVIWAFASAVLAGTWRDSDAFYQFIDRLGVIPLLILLVSPIVYRTARQRAILIGTLVILGAYLGFTAVLETLGLDSLVWPSYIGDPNVGEHFGRARGPFAQAVGNGLALSACMVAGLVGTQVFKGRRVRMGSGAVAALCAAGVVFTLTRSIWIAAGVSLLLVVAAAPELRRFFIPLAIGGTVAVIALIVLVPGLGDSASERAGAERQVWDRLNLNSTATRMIETRPLIGFGWGEFSNDSINYFRQAPGYPITDVIGSPAHNTFLSNAAELGLIGVAVWTVALLLLGAMALVPRAPPDLRPYQLGFAAILIQFLIVANFVLLQYPFPNALLWAWGGLVVGGLAGRREAAAERVPAPATPGSVRSATAAG